jgi:hypothetical protein
MRRFLLLALALAMFAVPVPFAASAELVTTDPAEPIDEIVDAATRFGASLPGVATGPLVTPGRETDPVVLTGADFPSWAAPGDVTAKAPDVGGPGCQGLGEGCTHNTYEDPDLSTQELLDAEGVPVDRLLAYRYDDGEFVQIPFQVDEVFTRYLSNNASGFSFYSMVDQHTTYAFDREGFRWTESATDDACLAAPASDVATDPVPGLDTLDELAFMARDAGVQAPADAALPDGLEGVYEVAVLDPHRPDSPGYVYVALAEEEGPRAAFDASNGYVRYARDADADVFLFSQSSYRDYGNAPHGPWWDPATGTCRTDDLRQRRPGDQATVTTPRYAFRYEGRWLMTELRVSADPLGDWTYGADLVDRWKARAFQQRPGGETPCCGYEEEENNWGGSSQLLGELSGPVRTIRETWGADSGTNVVRRETFYRDEIRQKTYLRVHPIPPIDGIYAQWDHNAGAVETYYNPHVPDGVAIDGRNDEVFGNTYLHVSQEGILVDGDDSLSALIRDLNDGTPLVIGDPEPGRCSNCVSNDVDTADPLFSGPNALLAWEQIAGPHGTLVTRWSSEDVTPGGAAHAPFALPYYRDDACFDDGTGANPGPHLNPRRTDDGEFAFWTDADGEVRERECWDIDRHRSDPEYAADLDTARFTQGSIGTHGMHLLLIADSDNAATTLPLTEINAEQRIVVLPPTSENVGERYGRGFEKPLMAITQPVAPAAPLPSPDVPTGLHEEVDTRGELLLEVVADAIAEDASDEVVDAVGTVVPDLPLPLAGDIVTSLVAEAAQTMTPASLKRELVRTHPPRDWVTSVGAIEDMSTGAPPEGAADTAPSPSAQPAPTTSSGTTTATADIRDIAPSDSTSVARHVAIVLASFGGSLGGALVLGVALVLLLGRVRGIRRDVH